MEFVRVRPDDDEQVDLVTELVEQARRADDPDAFPTTRTQILAAMTIGIDLEPEDFYLCVPDAGAAPVGLLRLEQPTRDNRELIWADLTVRPSERRRGHGSALMSWVLEYAREVSRPRLWIGMPADRQDIQRFADRHGFRPASADARRRQVLGGLDRGTLEQLRTAAHKAAAGYRLERLTPPLDERVLAELVEATAAINDAPMGTLTYEDEVFDLDRLRDKETAAQQSGHRSYRVVARHVATGQIAGHTELRVEAELPQFGHQQDTTVVRAHRGHRLGLLLKLEMLAWLADAEPQLTEIETWNNADNRFMIAANEALGYQLSRVYQTWERVLS